MAVALDDRWRQGIRKALDGEKGLAPDHGRCGRGFYLHPREPTEEIEWKTI